MALNESIILRVEAVLADAIQRAEMQAHFLRPYHSRDQEELKGLTGGRYDESCRALYDQACVAVDELRRIRDDWRVGGGLPGRRCVALVIECSGCRTIPDYDASHARCKTTWCKHFGVPVARENWNAKHWPSKPNPGGDQ